MDNYEHQKLIRNVRILDRRIAAAGRRLGLDWFQTDHHLVADEQMLEALVYHAMPVHYNHWRFGKAAQQGQRGHFYEVVINTNPSYCYLSTSNDVRLHALVIAHAMCGHVDFFKNNRTFQDTHPEDVIERFAANAAFIDSLYKHPDWGAAGVELYLDAAHALEMHCGIVPTLPGEDTHDEKKLRQQLLDELRNLKSQLSLAQIQMDRDALTNEIQMLENRLKCHPLTPTADLLKFLADPENTQHLPDEARRLLLIVREQSRYFQPQIRTKFLNEGWAMYWERELLLQPEVALPFNLHFDLAADWAMFDRNLTNLYFDPYALGEQVWHWVDEKYGYVEKQVTVPFRDLEYDETAGELHDGRKRKKRTIPQRNRDVMFEKRRNWNDSTGLMEVLSKEFIEFLNHHALAWMRGTKDRIGMMEQINRILRQRGWGKQYIFDPLPDSLEGLLQVVQVWHNAAESSQQWQQNQGTPSFPVLHQVLEQMATILQIVGGFDEDWKSTRAQIIRRTGISWVPYIENVDTGRHTDGVWTLRHGYDPDFGPLLPSEARDVMRFYRLLCGAPVRLLTMEQPVDELGEPDGDPRPYEYFTEDGDTVIEQYL